MELIFLTQNKREWGNLQKELSSAAIQHLNCGKDFKVKFEEIKDGKTWLQVKGIHKLCQLIAVRLSEIHGINYSLENAKYWVKNYFGYTEKPSEEYCLAFCMNARAIKRACGEEMSKKNFAKLLDELKKNLQKPKSFADATKEEMMGLIEQIHAFAAGLGWDEIKLENEEVRSLVDFYNNI